MCVVSHRLYLHTSISLSSHSNPNYSVSLCPSNLFLNPLLTFLYLVLSPPPISAFYSLANLTLNSVNLLLLRWPVRSGARCGRSIHATPTPSWTGSCSSGTSCSTWKTRQVSAIRRGLPISQEEYVFVYLLNEREGMFNLLPESHQIHLQYITEGSAQCNYLRYLIISSLLASSACLTFRIIVTDRSFCHCICVFSTIKESKKK